MNRLFTNNFLRLFSRDGSEEIFNETNNDNIELNIVTTQNLEELQPNQRHKFTMKIVSDCKDFSEALQYFDSSAIRQEFETNDKILLLKFQLDEIYGPLSHNEEQHLSKKCKNKTIVVVFTTKSESNFLFYWKSKEISRFLTLSPISDVPAETNKNFYEYLADVLADSLANGHLGLSSAVTPLAEKGGCFELQFIADSRDFNLLLLAAESGRDDIVKIMLKRKLDTELQKGEQRIQAQDLAYAAQHYDVVLTLLKAGATYPVSFNINDCSTELKEFCERSEELHAAIVDKNMLKIYELLNQSQNSHPFYDHTNKSAAKTALDSKQIGIYELLIIRKVFLGRHEVLHDSWEIFNEQEREKLRKIHFKHAIHLPEKHLSVLKNCSSVTHDDENVHESINLTQYAFGILNQIMSIRIILMIVAASKKLKIFFDFKSETVNIVDPTASSNMRGLFYLRGIICIAANHLRSQSRENETFGTLAHELCHYAMLLVYRNIAKPYGKKDQERRKEFSKIAKICKENREKNNIIDLVFSEYPPRLQHAELIVRVPHLMALYHNKPEELKVARENFSKLFDYYEQKVVPDMEKALPRIEKKIDRIDTKILKNKIITYLFVFLSIIAIIAGFFIIPRYKAGPRPVKFSELSETDKNMIRMSVLNYKNVQLKFQDLFPQNHSVFEELNSELISQLLNGRPLNFSDPHVQYLCKFIDHDWENLPQKLKEKILDSNFIFQNSSLNFRNFYEKVPKVFNVLTSKQIKDVLNGKKLAVDKLIVNETNFYVERRFWDDDCFAIYWEYRKDMWKRAKYDKTVKEGKFREYYQNFVSQNVSIYMQKITEIKQNSHFKDKLNYDLNYFDPLPSFETFKENFEEILKKSQKSKMFILSGEAGTGKTVTFEQFTIRIKEKFPFRWVSYIDLKDHKQFYDKNEMLENTLGLLEKILGLNSNEKFEKKIFEELFKEGEVVLLWNGFDEISPTYSDFILKVLGSIHNGSENIQFVCTRPLYTDRLSNEFNVHPYTLVKFDEEKKKEFLRKFFITAKVDEEKIQNFTNKVYKIIKALSVKVEEEKYREDFNTPLMLKMIAELITDKTEIYESENIYEIYQKFIKKKIEIWKNKSSDFASNFTVDSITDYSNFRMMRMYQMYALKTHYEFEVIRNLKIMYQTIPKKLTTDEISRMGILYINGKYEFKFAHKTFAEFFIAQFFIEHIYNMEVADLEDTTLIIEFFHKLTAVYGQIQVMETRFIKSFLQTEKAKENESFNLKITEIFKTKFRSFFFDFLFIGNIEIFEFLFSFFKKDHKLLIDFLRVGESETLFTASYNCAYFEHSNNLNHTRLKELGRSHLAEEEYKKFICGRNQKGIILYSLYIFYRQNVDDNRPRTVYHDEYDLDEEILENKDEILVLDLILKNLTKNELKEFFLSKSSPATNLYPYFFENENFWKIVNHSLTHHEKKIFIMNLFGRISKISRYSYVFPVLFTKTSQILTRLEIFELFKERNILHLSSTRPYFAKMLNFLVKHTTKEQQKEIFSRQVVGECFLDRWFPPNRKCYDSPSLNILQIGIIRNIDSNFTLELYEEYFNKTEIQEIISKSNNFLFTFIVSNLPEKYKTFANYLKNLFSGNKKSLDDFLLRKIKNINLNIFEYFDKLLGDYHPEELMHFKPFSDLL